MNRTPLPSEESCPRTTSSSSRIDRKKITKLLAVLLALGVWQLTAFLLDSKILLASPADVAVRLFSIWREPGFFSSIWFSFSRIVCGFLAGLLAGALLALAAGRSWVVEALLMPYMVTVKSVPVASFIVIALIWLTSSSLSIFISFLIVLPIVYTNLLSGLKSADKSMLEMADVFHVPYRRRLLYIRLPEMKPFILSACSVSCGLAWKSGIAAEVIGIPNGSIGEMLYYAKVYLSSTDLFAWTAIIVLLSVGFEKLFTLLLKFALRGTEKL